MCKYSPLAVHFKTDETPPGDIELHLGAVACRHGERKSVQTYKELLTAVGLEEMSGHSGSLEPTYPIESPSASKSDVRVEEASPVESVSHADDV